MIMMIRTMASQPSQLAALFGRKYFLGTTVGPIASSTTLPRACRMRGVRYRECMSCDLEIR